MRLQRRTTHRIKTSQPTNDETDKKDKSETKDKEDKKGKTATDKKEQQEETPSSLE